MKENHFQLLDKDYQEIATETKRKIRILKEALLNERKNKIYHLTEKLKKIELQHKKRQQKNEALLLQIRSLKDALIVQKTQKQQYMLEVKEKQQREKAQANGQNNISFSNMFGLKKLFQK